MSTINLFLIFSLFLQLSFSYKILVFSPATSKSHLISNGRVADELARAGHDVTLLELDFLNISDVTNTGKVAKKRIIRGWENSRDFYEILRGFSTNVMKDPGFIDELGGMWSYQVSYNKLCEEFIKRDDVFNELKNENFDGFFAEQINLCGHAYAYALGIKHRFVISSCAFAPHVYDFTSLPMPSSIVPYAKDMSLSPTYIERFRNLFFSVYYTIQYRIVNMYLDDILQRKYGKDMPPSMEIAGKSEFIFIATDEIIDYSTTTLQNIAHVGGIGIENDAGKLNKEFESEMEKGKNGVIYFSLGTIANTSSIDNKVMESFIGKIVKKFPDYHFLIRADKYDSNTRQKAEGVKNVLVSDWLPQAALLRHPRLRLFITHAGYNSIMEAAQAGVPLITIPFMFDQNLNSRAVEKKGWGIRRVKSQLLNDPDSIESAITEILTNSKYAENAKRIRDLIQSKPTNSKDRLIKTTEWVIKNGGVRELSTEGLGMSVVRYYNLDIIIPIFLIFIYFIFPFLTKYYTQSCFGHLKEKKMKYD